MKIILASASPRRQELLRYLYDTFAVVPANVDESVPKDMKSQSVPAFLAEKKAAKVADENQDALVIAADTIVLSDREMLGKPKDEKDAARMLASLSGRTHQVLTGCCISFHGKSRTFTVESHVTFYPLSEKDIYEYVQSGEPLDKAGAYAIQGKGAFFVRTIAAIFTT